MPSTDPDECFVKSSPRSQSPSGSRQQTSIMPPTIVEQGSPLEASSMFSKRQSSPQVPHEDAGNPMYTSPSSNRRSRTPRPKAFRPQSQSLELAAIVVTPSLLQTAMVDPPLTLDRLQPEPLAPPHTPCLRSTIDFDHSAKDVPLPVTPGTAGVVPLDEGCCSSLQNDLTARLENTEHALVVQKHEYQKTIDKLEVLIEDLSRDLHTTNRRFQQKSDHNGVLKMETRRATQEKTDAEERERVTKLALQRSRTESRELRSVMDMQQNMLREYTIKNQDLTSQRDASCSKLKILETSLAETIIVKETCLKELQKCREICQRLYEERKYIRHWTEKIMELKSKDSADYMLLYDHLKNQSVHRTDEDYTMSISPLVPQQTLAKALEVASSSSPSPISEISRKESSPHETKIESGLDHELVTTKVFKASFWDKYDLKQVPHSALEMHNLQPFSSNMIKTLNLRLETGNTPVEVIDAILTDALNNFHALAKARNLASHQIFSSDDMRISEVSTSSSFSSTKPTLKLRIPRVARPVQPVSQRPIMPYVPRHQPARAPRKDSTVSSATSSDVSYHNDRMGIKRRGSSISTTPRTTPESESQTSAFSASRFPRLLGLRGGSGGSRRSIFSFSSSESWLPSITWSEDQGTPSTGSEQGIQTTTKSPRRTHGDGVLRVLGKLYLHAESLILAFVIGSLLITRPFSNSFNGYEVFSRHTQNVTMSHPVVDTTVRPLGKMFITSNPMTLMNTTELLLCKSANKSLNESQILTTQCANLIEVDDGIGDNQTTATTSLQDIQRMVKPVVETQYITVFADGAIPPLVSCPAPPPLPPVECPKLEPIACPIQTPVSRCPHPYSYPDPCPCLEDINPKKPFNPTAQYGKMKAKPMPPGFPSSGSQRSDSKTNMTLAGEQNQQDRTLSDSAAISGSGSGSESSYDRPRRPTKVDIIKWGDHVRPGRLGPIPPIQRLLSAIRNKLLS
ncbi:hypothetical protein PV10_04130 [Exophiala mesophila]|uniref:Uncharacterized protein n=1 Tax=Exophiala mesophila TaxID=212818 RepID=A0A0D1XXA7_EXOME|nr:uncharacterized protein PV10_04130 [Exophiala mesophila]KIV92866.1 hypothetical protein PV10_04130 [Exophiala mesophila]